MSAALLWQRSWPFWFTKKLRPSGKPNRENATMSQSRVPKQAWYGLWLEGNRLRTPRSAAERNTSEFIFTWVPRTRDSGERRIGPLGRHRLGLGFGAEAAAVKPDR